MRKPTHKQIEDAIRLLQRALEAKHPESHRACITITPDGSMEPSYIKAPNRATVARGPNSIAAYIRRA